jgi:hypothetical protein
MFGFPNTTEIAIKLLIAFNGFDSVLYSPFTPSLNPSKLTRQSFFLTVKLTTFSFFKTHNTQTTNGLDETQKVMGKNVIRFFSNLKSVKRQRATVQPG